MASSICHAILKLSIKEIKVERVHCMQQIMKLNVKTVVISLLSLVLLASVFAQVSAQEGRGGSGVSLSPTRTELSILPGDSEEAVITVRNITSDNIIARPVINDFEADENNGGSPRLLGSEEESAQSVVGFVRGLEDVELAPNESKEITFDVIVPQEAFPGGYYGAIRFQAVPLTESGEENPGQISLTASVASLLFVEVPGDIFEDVQVDFVKAFVGENTGSIFTSRPDFAGVSITNNGDSFIKPFGSVKLENFSGENILTYEVNDQQPRGNVLPDSSRVFRDQLLVEEVTTVNGEETPEQYNPIRWPGRYKICADVSYGSGGEIFTVSSTFWYIPSWLIITMVVVIASLIGLGVYLYRKHTTKTTRRRK